LELSPRLGFIFPRRIFLACRMLATRLSKSFFLIQIPIGMAERLDSPLGWQETEEMTQIAPRGGNWNC
jgi:hypothetical protein